MRDRVIGAGFALLGASGMHRLAAPFLRGFGALLMFHRVRPAVAEPFAPNRVLEITPDFLDAVLRHLEASGYAIVTIDEAVETIRSRRAPRRPFAVLTFDDATRDFTEHAMPVLERHRAPFTLYVTSGFAAGTAHLWWAEAEEAIRCLDRVTIGGPDDGLTVGCRTPDEKMAAFLTLYTRLRAGDEAALRAEMACLREQAGLDGAALTRSLCLDWEPLGRLARHPLATIGGHSLTHPRLARIADDEMLEEIEDSCAEIASRLGRPVRHFAYPVGDPGSAGPREFAAVRAFGLASAVTTRPGLVYADHADHLEALPRLSINGKWQDLRAFDILLSGTAFALWNRGRLVNAA